MQDMGINQLANMYMGNPQPLAQKVQQAQQQAKPGQIPPDLKEALALQQIQDMRNAAMNQQAMQAGGPQPTVVDQLKQMLMQRHAPQPAMPARPQMQGQPPMATQPAPQGLPQGMPQGAPQEAPPPEQPGLPQLPTSLGQHLAGGGIIAFAGGGNEGLDVEQRDKLSHIEAAYNQAVTDQLNADNTKPPAAMPAAVAAGARDILGRNVLTSPEQLKRERVADYDATVGAPNLEVFNRAAQEYERRKQQFEAPKTGMPALMEYLQQIALAPKGVGSLTAGAMGAQKVNEIQKNRELQQFELNKQILDIEQKKIESLRAYAKDKFNIGDTAFNTMFKANLDAAKQVTQNDLEAEKIAAQRTEAQLRRETDLKIAKDRNAIQSAHDAQYFAHLKRADDLAELTKPTSEDINFNRIMGKINQDPEIKNLAKRLEQEELGSDQYRQTQKTMHEKMKTYFSRHPELLPPLAEMSEMAEPLAKPKTFEESFKSMADWGWYPGKTSAAKPAGTVSFDQLPK
jgi:hypothetical protein